VVAFILVIHLYSMRAFLAILLACAFLLQPASKLLILAHYELNREFIAQNLCENRSKPMLHCNGKCHLKKQLQKEDRKETPFAGLKEKPALQFFAQKKVTLFFYVFADEAEQHFNYLFRNYKTELNTVFHPPCA
jgi:hypothetical protein